MYVLKIMSYLSTVQPFIYVPLNFWPIYAREKMSVNYLTQGNTG